MEKNKINLALIAEGMAKTDLPFTFEPDGKVVIFAEPSDMSMLLFRLSRLVSGFKYISNEEKYFELEDGGRIYIARRDTFCR